MSKIYYGLSNVHYAVLDESTKEYSTPKAIPGAVSLGLSIEGDSSDFFADNIKYFTATSNNGYSGDLEVAKVTEEFLIDCLGFEKDANGAVTEIATALQKPFALLFQIEGDLSGRRYVYFNAKASRPTRNFSTKNESIEPETETLTITISPALLGDKMVVGTFLEPTPQNASAYNGWYEEVYTPTTGVTPQVQKTKLDK